MLKKIKFFFSKIKVALWMRFTNSLTISATLEHEDDEALLVSHERHVVWLYKDDVRVIHRVGNKLFILIPDILYKIHFGQSR